MTSRPHPSPAHDLLPARILPSLPPLSATSEESDPTVWLKWFTPDGQWTWFVLEYNPADRIAHGLVQGVETEFGSFSVAEIEGVRGALGLRVERDLYFEPMPLSQVQRRLGH
jgi:hypothetical protein